MKTAIFGLGLSGLSALNSLIKSNDEIFIVNQGDPNTWPGQELIHSHVPKNHLFAQEDALEILGSVDQIIISPGIDPRLPILQLARENKVSIISEIEYAYRNSSVPVIGITGTNGKTTTATMIAELLTRAGLKVFLGGNIGRPYCEIIGHDDYDIAVIELSSFQLEGINTFKPHIGIILNISKSHDERYDSFKEYQNAKLRLFQNMSSSELSIREKDLLAPSDFDTSASHLVGKHNRSNFYCAYLVLKHLCPDKMDIFSPFVSEFAGVPHRTQFLGKWNELSIYNDAKSTNAAATLAAISSFDEHSNLTLIIGGKMRDDTHPLSDLIDLHRITNLLLIGESSHYFKRSFREKDNVMVVENLEGVKTWLLENRPSGVLLFSPGLPSFDQFMNYVDRGEKFCAMIEGLKKII